MTAKWQSSRAPLATFSPLPQSTPANQNRPRSESFETVDGVKLPSYRGDIINSEAFTEEARRNNPWLMLEAYHQSTQTLNILRAFATGGYADISRLHAWNLDFVVSNFIVDRCVVLPSCLMTSHALVLSRLIPNNIGEIRGRKSLP